MLENLHKSNGCKGLFFGANANSHLPAQLSHLTRTLATSSAAALVVASAGFGAVFAWSTGSQHGVLLGALSVLMAVALEAAKPLAFAGSLSAFGRLDLSRGLALGVLAGVAILYSLSAELTLVATSRGDVVASRAASLRAAQDGEAEAQRARDRYDAAKAELAALGEARPAAEVESDIAALLLTPGADGCNAINGKVSREVCPKVAASRIELGRAQRRAELEAIMAAPLPKASVTGHEVSSADPGATALAVYLGALGVRVSAPTLSEFLVLIPVLALEAGSALAAVLAGAYSVSGPTPAPASPPAESPATTAPEVSAVKPKRTRRTRGNDEDGGSGGHREKVIPQNVVELLRKRGGHVEGGQRGLAKLLSTSKSRLNEVLREMAQAGEIVVAASKFGTRIQLA